MPVKPKIWTRDFILHWLGYLFIATSFYFLLPTLPIYVINELGEDKSEIGYIIGVYAISALIIRPFSGYSLDVFGRKTVFVASLVVYTLTMGSYFFASTFVILLIIRFLHGLAWGVVTTGGSTITADLVPLKRRGEGIGYFGLTMVLSMALGPVIGLWIMQGNAFNALFLASVLVAFIALTLNIFVKHPNIRSSGKPKGFKLENFFEKRVLHICFVMLIAGFSYAGIMSFISIYGEELGVANPGWFFLIYAIGVGMFRPMAGKIMDKHGPQFLMIASFIISILGLFYLSQINTPEEFLLSAFILGIGNGVIMPTIQTMVINMVEPDRRGVANSTFFSAIDLGIGIGSILLGYIAEMYSTAIMYAACGFTLFVPFAYFVIFVMKDYNKKIQTVS